MPREIFTMFVTIPLKPECVDEFLYLVNAVNDRMRHEPTFVNTALSRSGDDPSLFMLHETWVDRDDFFEVQMRRDYRAEYEGRLPAMLRGEREMRVCVPVRSDFAFMSGPGEPLLSPATSS